MTSIIAEAIELEKTAEAAYLKAARETTDPSAGEILTLLAREEAAHAAALRRIPEDEDMETGRLLDEARAWIGGLVEGGATTISPDATLLGVLRRAMDIERTTESFYRRQSDAATDEIRRNLFLRLAQSERAHFLFVSSLIEFFDRPSEWIESAEFGLRDEY